MGQGEVFRGEPDHVTDGERVGDSVAVESLCLLELVLQEVLPRRVDSRAESFEKLRGLRQ
eukprot:456380-Rhodomonas_salina.4